MTTKNVVKEKFEFSLVEKEAMRNQSFFPQSVRNHRPQTDMCTMCRSRLETVNYR